MKLGFVTAILPDLSLEKVAQFAGMTGYDCIEVMCWPPSAAERRYAGVTHINVDDLDEEQIEQIHAQLENEGVSISALGYYPNPLSPNEDEARHAVEHLKKVIEGAAKLGLENVNSFIGRDWTKSVDENWPRFLKTWRPIIKHAEEHGIKIGIENCPMLFTKYEWPGGKNLGTTPKIWTRMFTDIQSDHFGLNYDPSHMVWQQMDYLAPIRDFKDKLFHIHAKDVRMDLEKLNQVGILAHPNEYHTPKLPGMGEVNWGKFFSYLTDTGYQGPVCVEVEDRAFEGSLELRKASLRQSCNYLRNYLPMEVPSDQDDEDGE